MMRMQIGIVMMTRIMVVTLTVLMMTMVVKTMTMMVMVQASARRAEKALQEILHKADHDSNGKVTFSHFTFTFTLAFHFHSHFKIFSTIALSQF